MSSASPEIGLRARRVAMTSWIGCAIPSFRTQILAAVERKDLYRSLMPNSVLDLCGCDMLKPSQAAALSCCDGVTGASK